MTQKKFGRGLRTPGRKRYKLFKRWETNKINKLKRYMKWLTKKSLRAKKGGRKTEGLDREIKFTRLVLKRLTNG